MLCWSAFTKTLTCWLTRPLNIVDLGNCLGNCLGNSLGHSFRPAAVWQQAPGSANRFPAAAEGSQAADLEFPGLLSHTETYFVSSLQLVTCWLFIKTQHTLLNQINGHWWRSSFRCPGPIGTSRRKSIWQDTTNPNYSHFKLWKNVPSLY